MPQNAVEAQRKWQDVEALKLRLPVDSTYRNMTSQELQQHMPVRVISLARAVERRQTILRSLETAGQEATFYIATQCDKFGMHPSITREGVNTLV